jgi:hypothetical protein
MVDGRISGRETEWRRLWSMAVHDAAPRPKLPIAGNMPIHRSMFSLLFFNELSNFSRLKKDPPG